MFVFICFFHHTPAKLPLLAVSSSNSCFYVGSPQLSLPLLVYCTAISSNLPAAPTSLCTRHTHTHNDTASNKWRCLSTDFNLDFAPSTSRRWKLIFIYKLWDLRFSWFQTFALFCMFYVFFWVIHRLLNFICRRVGTLCLFHHLYRQVDEEWLNLRILGVFVREKVWLENSLSW